MVTILMMLAKMATLDLLKIKVFWKQICDVIVSVRDVTNKVLLGESNYIVNMIMWPKLCNSSISMGEVIMTSIL